MGWSRFTDPTFSKRPEVLATAITSVTAAGAAVTAAVYVNFSTRVMARLAELPTPEAVSTMQGFNRTAVQGPFMTAFFGAAAGSVGVLVRVVRAHERTSADWLAAAGAASYLAGFPLTIAYNVPRNDRLAALDPSSAAAALAWPDYVSQWTAANTVRAGCSVAAVVPLASGVVLGRR